MHPVFYLWEFPILRFTKHMAVIFDGTKERKILKVPTGKQYAYLKKIDARHSFVKRKTSQYHIVAIQYEQAKQVLSSLAQDWGVEDDRIPHYHDIEKVYEQELRRQKEEDFDS